MPRRPMGCDVSVSSCVLSSDVLGFEEVPCVCGWLESRAEPGTSHCQIHHVDEYAVGAYRTCHECFHVFFTEADLIGAHNRDPGARQVTSGDEMWSCPECIHDF